MSARVFSRLTLAALWGACLALVPWGLGAEDINGCDPAAFSKTPAGVMIVVVEELFVVRKAQGFVFFSSDKREPLAEARFEIVGSAPGSQALVTQSDAAGQFVIDDLPEGVYCFKLFLPGWQPVFGRLQISAQAKRKSVLELELFPE